MREDWFQYSSTEIVRILGVRFKEYRMRAQLTQQEVAERSGVSVTTIYKFENQQVTSISLTTFIMLLKALGRPDILERILPELEVDLYAQMPTGTTRQRIRHKK